ncbi:MAG: DUF3868 domain-containing protein [Bacteroides sp.]|nr:DUF3868 domain-containing protein [Bacteroides sp.]
MILNRKIKCMVCLCLLLPSLVQGQSAYRGRLFLDSLNFSLTGGKLEVVMDVNYEGLELPSDEYLTLTPLLISGGDRFTLPSVLLNGRMRQKVYERSRLLGEVRNSAPAVVVRAGKRGTRHFRYTVCVPFREWMSGSTFFFRTEECGCNGSPASVYTDSIASDVLLPSVKVKGLEKDVDVRCLSWVEFLSTPSDSTVLMTPACPDSGVTLKGLFALACCYRPGSVEFNSVYTLAARLFPDNAEAAINAAAVALVKRDTRTARHYLSRFSTLPEAFNNMGVLCMLEGNREKAEVYLEMAVSRGVKHASTVLGELHKRASGLY